MRKRKKYRILSLDGGGINGIMTANILDQLDIDPDSFDLIAGTSTGSILAVALRMGYTPEDIVNLYLQHGREIFPPYYKRIFQGRPLGGLWRARYSAEPLEKILRSYFETTFLGDLNPVIITATNLHTGDIEIFKSWKDRMMLAVSAVRSSTAAPVYFPANGMYIDGGIAANHPGTIAIAEAVKKGYKLSQIEMISVGTGFDYEPPAEWKQGLGVLPFGLTALELIMRTQVRASHQVCKRLLSENYVRYNAKFVKASGKMDDASEKNLTALLDDSLNYDRW